MKEVLHVEFSPCRLGTDPELVQLEIEVEQLEAEETLGRRQLRQLIGDAAATRRKAREWRTTDDKPATNTST